MAEPGNAHDRDARAAERFEQLFRRHHRAVAAYVRRRAPGDSCDDVVASAFLVAWRRLDEVPADSLPWLLAVARNVIATQRRGLRRRGALRLRLEHADGSATPRTAPEEPAGRVATALGRLPENDREAITLIAWDGLRPSEAATVLGQSPAAFRVRLHRAKRRLRRELDRADQTDPHPQHPSVAKEIAP
ncbi:MAG TPA: sigma-70 family RNA polymerase sigma factor [Gaiellales bacterium]|jgi:RNA polymerase sigma-70 factor, ECF subfamily|nr:sigma-70 family RNA polymerase sigma factor [Gaiellales bacterium]